MKDFHDRRGLVNALAYLMRSRRIDRIVALRAQLVSWLTGPAPA